MMKKGWSLWIGFQMLLACALFAESTEVVYLSGTGKDNTVDWEFYCTGGAKSGYWTTIPVPSCWEQKGFGELSYGKDNDSQSKESGIYKYTFHADSAWQGKQVNIVFEGSMTDTEVQINGQSAGAKHQGAFYRFKYDISNLLTYGTNNELRVDVDKFSANTSVNLAERYADYWVFGGIFRPVYLEILPAQSIERTAIDAKADGSFNMDVYLQNISETRTIECQIQTTNGVNVGSSFSNTVNAGETLKSLQKTLSSPALWTAETPNLYQVVVRLKNGSTTIHEVTERFGFRTIEVRLNDGVYVNNRKILLKGTNRHSFYPDTGRTLCETNHIQDITLMKEMNMNAVRMSHYPPDKRFLELCDEMGLYVLDELAGWQDAYDTTVGEKLIEEMVTRDVNHPSIVFWDNGNEGGWNTSLDDDFAIWDPQGRTVIHPKGDTFNGIESRHYISYSRLQTELAESSIFITTEFLHGLFDGGSGAGLDDYWREMLNGPRAAGGFLWAFCDEGVKNQFTGQIDTAGNFAPDGILGPYREKEANYYAVKEIWSPIQLSSSNYYENTFPSGFDGTVGIQNNYDFINADQLGFEWKLVNYRLINETNTGFTVMASGTGVCPSIEPDGEGHVSLSNWPADWGDYDALYFTARDPAGKELWTWTWPIKTAAEYTAACVDAAGDAAASGSEDSSNVYLSAAGTQLVISKSTGSIVSVTKDGQSVSLNNGPVLTTGSQSVSGINHYQDGSNYVLQVSYSGNFDYAKWTMLPSGWIELNYQYTLNTDCDHMGISFSYPESKVNGMKWLGEGPYRVWKNRMKGPSFSVWQKDYNNAITGSTQNPKEYPEFKGYHAGMRWSVINTDEGNISIVSKDEDLFLRMFTPNDAPDPKLTAIAGQFPTGDISLLDGIDGIGTKFQNPEAMGPQGAQNAANGSYQRTVYFKFDAVESSGDPDSYVYQELPIAGSSVGSTEPGNLKEYAYDGDVGTRWCNDNSLSGAWIEYDLGSAVQIDRIMLFMHKALSDDRSYPIEISVDGSPVWSGSTTAGTDWTQIDLNSTPGQLVTIRMTGNNSTGTKWFSIHETEIYTRVASSNGYDAWASANSINGGPLDDEDGDGRNNLYEYVLGGDPNDALDIVDPVLFKEDGLIKYIYSQRNDDTNLTYIVERSTNLVEGVWNSIAINSETNITGGVYDKVTHTIPVDQVQSYIRLKIEDQHS